MIIITPNIINMLINIEYFEWDKLVIAKSGKKNVLLYNKEPLEIATSVLYCPFGIKSSINKWSSQTEYYLEASIYDRNNESTQKFQTFIDKLDQWIQTKLLTDFAEVSPDDTYYPILKTNGDYPPLIKINIPRDKNGNFLCFMFDENKQKVNITEKNINDLLKKGTFFKLAIECSNIWAFNTKYGSKWNAKQLRFIQPKLKTQDGNLKSQNEQSKGYNEILI